MKTRQAGITHAGLVRPHNEDTFVILTEHDLFIVADGIGGHNSGEVASRIAVDAIMEFFDRASADKNSTWPYTLDPSLSDAENLLITSVKLANSRIHEAAEADPQHHGMGTTIVSLLLGPTRSCVAHVGDSRAYVIRDGGIEQLTRDHSLLNEYARDQAIDPKDMRDFPYKNIIVRALGANETVDVEFTPLVPTPGELYLLCSDGLTDMVDDEKILELIQDGRSNLERTCQLLIDEANVNGGSDNVTVILIEVCD